MIPISVIAIAIMMTLRPAKLTPAAQARVSARAPAGSSLTTRLAIVAAATIISPMSATTMPASR